MHFGKMRFNKILGNFLTLESDERIDLVQQREQNAQVNIDFIMLLLSTSLASLGLLADSTAVVIGAILVAPLMGPLIDEQEPKIIN